MTSKVVRKTISTNNAPAPIGPFSQAVQAGNLLFISGHIGMDPKTMKLVEGGVAAETERMMISLGALLEQGGSCFKNVVKTTILLSDMNDFAVVNQVYGKFFPESSPARTTYQVSALPVKEARVEIDAIAIIGEISSE